MNKAPNTIAVRRSDYKGDVLLRREIFIKTICEKVNL